MISEDNKIAYKKILGGAYSNKVKEQLELKGVKDSSGKTHSNIMIRQVMNGECAHALIEDAILDAVEHQLNINERVKKITERIVKAV